MPVDECRGRLDGFPSTIGHVDHNKMDVITERAILLVKIRHLALTPVSYTHLDVYKRQAGDGPMAV